MCSNDNFFWCYFWCGEVHGAMAPGVGEPKIILNSECNIILAIY